MDRKDSQTNEINIESNSESQSHQPSSKDEKKNQKQSLRSYVSTAGVSIEKRMKRRTAGKEKMATTPRSSLRNVYIKHIYILTHDGKPIFSSHGDEHTFTSHFRLIYLLINSFKTNQDDIESIATGGKRFVFLLKPEFIFAIFSNTNLSVSQLKMQLDDVYYQVLSFLMFCNSRKTFAGNPYMYVGRHLKGAVRIIRGLTNTEHGNQINKNIFRFLTRSVQILPLKNSDRSSITDIIQRKCKTRKHNLLFAIIMIDNQLITLICKNNVSMDPGDLRLIFNFVDTLEPSEFELPWYKPFFLPRYDRKAYLHAHISILTQSCRACVLFITSETDDFFNLSLIKKSITKSMEDSPFPSVINEAVLRSKQSLRYSFSVDFPKMMHFVYKPTGLQQLICTEFSGLNTSCEKYRYIEDLYCKLIDRLHKTDRPAISVYEARESEVMIGWLSPEYELYAVFEPYHERSKIIDNLNEIIQYVRRKFRTLFIKKYATFCVGQSMI
uniref:Vacuolar fusion protein MON1 homolog n=1 Tax=Glossina brevipalpis TaxID=37001 RepID=A0A1A9WDW9_9MUSC